MSAHDPSEPRPRVTGWFLEPDEKAAPLLQAIGRVVWGAAALEKCLLLELMRLRAERDGQFPAQQELSRLELLPAGPLLAELRKLDLPNDLDERIADAIGRRNELLHHPAEDPEMVKAVGHGEGIDAVVRRVEHLAIDCGALAVELQLVAGARLEAMVGMTPAEMVEALKSIDLDVIDDARWRRQLEAVHALGNLDLTLLPEELPADSPGE